MFNPLEELFAAMDVTGATLVLEDPTILGEVGGVLYGDSQRDSYLRDGGALYPTPQLLNKMVVGYDNKASLGYHWRSQGGSNHASPIKDLCLYTPYRLLDTALRAAASVFPVLRVLFPSAVPRRSPLLLRSGALEDRAGIKSSEQITTLRFHPYLMILAIVLDEGGCDGSARVVIYDIAKNRHLAVLAHAFQKEVQTVAWKPLSKEVLAVGCRGGVLLWTLNGCIRAGGGGANLNGSGGDGMPATSTHSTANAKGSVVPHALFYKCTQGITVTSMSFSSVDGRYMACGSCEHTHLKVLDTSYGPHEASSSVCYYIPSIDGGVESLIFADDDSYIISSVCEAPILCITNVRKSAFGTSWVSTPAPVNDIAKATGIGINYYFLCSHTMEGVLLAKVNTFVGIEVVSVISTSLSRNVGGNVRVMACSKRRLWIALETGHLLVCHYSTHEGAITVIPIGAAAMEASHLVSFDGCSNGSLLAIAERAESVCFVPSYHI
ncbi:unnamed protein product [Phytomonas sp. Hart1]|nr:unnamed protein product [Phytomonas sp. Hart1]|eukprot:CCW66851.1 unnamed protein product [Phytomonas sp. isolate Hart1]